VIRVAAAQFPVGPDVHDNLGAILGLLGEATRRGADVVHFPESALCGYGPRHHPHGRYPWERLQAGMERVQQRAAQERLWVVLGTVERVHGGLPHNVTVVVSPRGEVVVTYGKRRLYGREHDAYTPGREPVIVDIEGVRCGLLICYENCFPELYAEARSLGAQLVFHSFYNAGRPGPDSLHDLMPAMLRVRAADHGLYISAANSSEWYSPLRASVVRPDGTRVSAERHVTGLAVAPVPADHLGWTVPEPTKGARGVEDTNATS